MQIFGFDILLDDKFRAWLIEVNTGPDLSSSSPLDKQLKHKMVAQMLHLVGVVPYDRCVTFCIWQESYHMTGVSHALLA